MNYVQHNFRIFLPPQTSILFPVSDLPYCNDLGKKQFEAYELGSDAKSKIRIKKCTAMLDENGTLTKIWTEIVYIKSTARLLNRDYVNRVALNLSK